MRHTPLPWSHFPYAGSDFGICQDDPTSHRDLAIVRDGDDAAFMTLACNCHDDLRGFLQTLRELADEGDITRMGIEVQSDYCAKILAKAAGGS